MMAESPIEYKYSSARFYETGIDEFGFFTHIGDRIQSQLVTPVLHSNVCLWGHKQRRISNIIKC